MFSPMLHRHILTIDPITDKNVIDKLKQQGCSITTYGNDMCIVLPHGAVKGTVTRTSVHFQEKLKYEKVETIYVHNSEPVTTWALIAHWENDEITRTLEMEIHGEEHVEGITHL